jgi:hypothetical protein
MKEGWHIPNKVARDITLAYLNTDESIVSMAARHNMDRNSARNLLGRTVGLFRGRREDAAYCERLAAPIRKRKAMAHESLMMARAQALLTSPPTAPAGEPDDRSHVAAGAIAGPCVDETAEAASS